MLLFLVALLVGVLVAHAVGAGVARGLRVAPGHIRRAMPSLPAVDVGDGSGRAWRRQVRAVEARLLDRFEDGVEGAHAAELAHALEAPVEAVRQALDRLRQAMPCRLRVTRGGRLLHDFSADAVAGLRARRRRTRPLRVGLVLLALLANVGAIWPVVVLGFLAAGSLNAMLEADAAKVGLVGLGALAALVVATLAFGWVMHRLLTPVGRHPRLGPAVVEPAAAAAPGPLAWLPSFGGGGHTTWTTSSGGGSSSSGGRRGKDGDGAGQAIIAIILIAIIALCLFTVWVWVRGVYRAVQTPIDDEDDLGPALWVRRREVVDRIERLLPTNDLVGRVLRALRRLAGQRRPADGAMSRRVLARAVRQGGVVTALEIQLHEALDPAEAMEVGTRLCTLLEGRVRVIGDGEVAFDFGPGLTPPPDASDDPHLWAEFLRFSPQGPAVRRDPDQWSHTLPVNLVGLRAGHLEATSRLAAGAWLMAASAAILFAIELPPSWQPYLLGLAEPGGAFRETFGSLLTVGTVLFAIGATALASVARYAAVTCAALGARRDARRAACQEVLEIIEAGRDVVDLGEQVRQVYDTLVACWPGVTTALIEKEMLGFAVDCDLEPVPEQGEGQWSLQGLAARYAAARAAAVEAAGRPDDAADRDAVVFDSAIELDRLVALA
ncbi:MAG: hypothetical protein H6704_10795 [Myxococcales bacterium]|nr:hypothetical protein [Myxococcales bacterium]